MLGDSLSAQNFTLSNIQMILFGNVSQGMKYRVSHCKMQKGQIATQPLYRETIARYKRQNSEPSNCCTKYEH